MRKILSTAVILALLTGCSTIAGFTDRFRGGDGGDRGVSRDAGTRGTPSRSAPAYPAAGSIDPYSGGVVLPYDDRFWPPVVQGQAFPQQHMWTD